METVTATQDDSSNANPSSIKSEDSSPHHDGGRGSPPPNCAICLGTCRNKSFTDSCLHQFCFKCLLTWSKVKAECPLCKQNFKSIIHNVRSNHQYEEYMVEQRQTEQSAERIDLEALTTTARRFRYRTTLTLPRNETMAHIRELFMHYPFVGGPAAAPPPAPPARRRRSPAAFRRTVYRHNLWARPLPDFTGRFRDCTPDFYRYNDSQIHRLVPWLNRELNYLLNENIGHINYVIPIILELLLQYHINSTQFRDAMNPYFGVRTEHFLHELYCFASTPYDLTGYDRNVQYTTDTSISTLVSEVLSSSESEASVDSDIVMVSHSEPSAAPSPGRAPGPSRPPPAAAQPPCSIQSGVEPLPPPTNVIPIETISHSDTDDDDEVMVVGYIRPPQDRTPEVVDLLESDSDVIVQDSGQPEPTQGSSTAGVSALNLVKFQLKRRNPTDDSDSEDSVARGPTRRRRRRQTGAAPAAAPAPAPAPAAAHTHPAPQYSPPHTDTQGSERRYAVSEPTWSSFRMTLPRYRPQSPNYRLVPSIFQPYSPPSPSYEPDSPSYRPTSMNYQPASRPPARVRSVAGPTLAAPSPRRRSSSHYTPSMSRSSSLSSLSTYSSSLTSFTSPTTNSDYSYSCSSTSSSNDYKRKTTKKKSKKQFKKTTKVIKKNKNKKRESRSCSRHRDRQSAPKSVIDKHSKRRSQTEKTKKKTNSNDSVNTPHTSQSVIPSTSGLSNRQNSESDQKPEGSNRETRRLKSVVTVLKNSEQRDSGDSTSSSYRNATKKKHKSKKSKSSLHKRDSERCEESEQDSDSEDNKPLNLTVQKTSPSSSS